MDYLYVYFYFRLGHYVLLVWKGICMFVVRRCFDAGEERVYLNDVIHTDMQKYYNKEKVWYVPPVFFDGCLYISYIVVYDNVLWI